MENNDNNSTLKNPQKSTIIIIIIIIILYTHIASINDVQNIHRHKTLDTRLYCGDKMLTSIIPVMKFSVGRVNVIGRRGARGYYSGTGERG